MLLRAFGTLNCFSACAALSALLLIGFTATGWAQEPPTPQREGRCGEPGAVAELHGKVSIAESEEQVAQVAVFNGHELLVSTTAKDGTYCLPLTRSTAGTLVSVFASAEKAVPVVHGEIRVATEDAEGKPPRIAVPDFNLQRSPNPDLGYVIGVAYIRVSGGRPVAQEGISHYDPGLKVTVEVAGPDVGRGGQRRTEHQTDKSGAFVLALLPGSYRLLTARNVLIDITAVQNSGAISWQSPGNQA